MIPQADPLVIALAGFAAVGMLVLAFALPGAVRARTVRRRIEGYVTFTVSGAVRDGTRAERPATTDPISGWLAERLIRARVDLSPSELASAMAVIAAGAVALAFGLVGQSDPVVGVIAGALGAGVPLLWLRSRERRILRRFRDQLPDTVGLLSNGIHAGQSLPIALAQVARDATEPTKGAFEVAVRELQLGADLSAVLRRLGERYPSDDLELVVAAIDLHRQTGGDLARVLDAIAETLRERSRIWSEVRVLTSQQRYSAYVLALLPAIVAVALFFISPDYLALMLEHEITRWGIVVAAILVIAGFWLMQKVGAVDA